MFYVFRVLGGMIFGEYGKVFVVVRVDVFVVGGG